MIRSKLCSKTSCDLVKSCLCRVDREAAARDVIKLLLTEPDHCDARRTDKLSLLHCHIGLCQSPASESFIIYGCQGSSLLHQMGLDLTQQQHQNPKRNNGTINTNNSTSIQLSVVLLKLREQLPSFFNGHHDFSLYSSNVQFEYCVGKESPMVVVGKQRYKFVVEAFRHVTRCMWTSPKLEVMKITKVVDKGTIECRWRVSGQLRGRFGKGKERILYDAFSVFTVERDGLICKHRLQKVMPQPTSIKAKMSWWDYLLTRVTARTTN